MQVTFTNRNAILFCGSSSWLDDRFVEIYMQYHKNIKLIGDDEMILADGTIIHFKEQYDGSGQYSQVIKEN